jgi:hypothetical protein
VAERRPTALVDARNVLRSQWPNIPEDELVALCCQWARTQALRAVVVFDRDAPGGGDEECIVIGTGTESADDWITREAAELVDAGERYWLVTSDRELRERAGRAAERTIGGGSFARELRSSRS